MKYNPKKFYSRSEAMRQLEIEKQRALRGARCGANRQLG
jgi:hypothetical protein